MSNPSTAAPGASFRAFLSHRYKSPRVNEYFFNLFDGIAMPQFEVDRGTIATSVTRLERLIRGSDGFIGFYPFTSDAEPTVEQLRAESRYFQLELDLAERAGKPAIVFIDRRYGAVLTPPPSMMQVRFLDAEVVPSARMPGEEEIRLRITEFCNRVKAARAYGLSRVLSQQNRTEVGILLPPEDGNGNGYASAHVDLIAAEIERLTPQRAVRLPWPPVLNSRFAAILEELDWLVVDLGPASAVCGIVSYLHGRFVPMLRLCRVSSERPNGSPPSQIEATLFGGFEVGYLKDIVRWTDQTSLKAEIERKIGLMYVEPTHITTRDQALWYFREAALRNEAVFVSYCGRDVDAAGAVIAALRLKFQQVFDYRADDRPIPAGTQWIEEIFKQIATRPLGVILLSPDYFESGHCRHEMNEMIARRNSGKMKIVPIKLRDVSPPPELASTQYLRAGKFDDDAAAIVAALIQDLDRTADRNIR